MAANARPPMHRASHQKGWRQSREIIARFDAKLRPRASAWARGYDKEWHHLRRAHLALEPRCAACAALGRAIPATIVDHIIAVVERPDLRLDPDNLQSLCKPCHDAKTVRFNHGFGNRAPR